jgi:ParB family chromosome partitioning protein
MSKAASKPTARKGRKRKPAEPTGLTPSQTRAKPPAGIESLCRDIEGDGGAVLAAYQDPLGGQWLVLAVLPLEQVEPTPYQRGLSEAHVKRLGNVIAKTGVYLDPVIAFRVGPKRYHTPNGHHRASALRNQGARSITALVVPEERIAHLILALNVEKAHNLREKALEAIRLARHLAGLPNAREADFSLEFEEPAFLTLGLCYEQNGRFAGGAYHPFLKRVDSFVKAPLGKSLEQRETYAKELLAIDERVSEVVKQLKDRGLESPYLRNFVVARINPVRFQKGAGPSIDEALDKMSKAAQRFKPEKISVGDLSRTGGPPESGSDEG